MIACTDSHSRQAAAALKGGGKVQVLKEQDQAADESRNKNLQKSLSPRVVAKKTDEEEKNLFVLIRATE